VLSLRRANASDTRFEQQSGVRSTTQVAYKLWRVEIAACKCTVYVVHERHEVNVADIICRCNVELYYME